MLHTTPQLQKVSLYRYKNVITVNGQIQTYCKRTKVTKRMKSNYGSFVEVMVIQPLFVSRLKYDATLCNSHHCVCLWTLLAHCSVLDSLILLMKTQRSIVTILASLWLMPSFQSAKVEWFTKRLFFSQWKFSFVKHLTGQVFPIKMWSSAERTRSFF